MGGSWGSALALAYAERSPEHVSEIVLHSVTTFQRVESDWLYRGVSRSFPEAFERFRLHVPEAEDGNLIDAYARRMESLDRAVRVAAAKAWCAWEDAVLSFETNANAVGYGNARPDELVTFARICTHYLRHDAWLEEGALLRDAARLASIPGVLIHGQRDMSCPPDTAWELSLAWPGSKLVMLPEAGHLYHPTKRAALLEALDTFART